MIIGMSSITKITRKILGCVTRKGSPSWPQIEYFNPEWKNRIRIMSQYIGKADSVVDLGCGQKWLKEFLSPANRYVGVDYRRRDGETIVCDFNKLEFPNVRADVYFISGSLEYIGDCDKFIENVVNFCQRCIISYCCIEEFPNITLRRRRAWVNHLTKEQLIEKFARSGMELTIQDKTRTNNSVFVFDKKER